MEKQEKTIMIVAGEDSGDLHAAHLIEEIKKCDPNISFKGLGGPKMKACGVELYEDLTKISVVGFFEVIRHYKTFKNLFELFLQKAKEIKPGCVILVDYPGFNLRLAKKLKQAGIKVIYYISPQVWAWKKNRIHQIKKYVDKMLVIFRFEKDFYKEAGMDVTFVGHPLIDTAVASKPKSQLLKENGLSDDKITIGLLPGSRVKEVDRHLPLMLGAAGILLNEFPQLQFLIIKAPSIERSLIEGITANASFPVTIIENQNYDAINACHYCLVTSGTATLEVAIFNKPMVVVYRTSWITYFIAKLLVKIPFISLVNIMAKKEVVPEFIQLNAKPEQIAHYLKSVFTDEIKIAEVKKELKDVCLSLDAGGASKHAADTVIGSL